MEVSSGGNTRMLAANRAVLAGKFRTLEGGSWADIDYEEMVRAMEYQVNLDGVKEWTKNGHWEVSWFQFTNAVRNRDGYKNAK
jgi:hypothetical protein